LPFNNSLGFNTAAMSDFIRRRGERLKYYSGMKCTCTSSTMMTGSTYPDPSRANPNCAACKGLGWIWIDRGEIGGLITNINQHKELLISGEAVPGDLVLSPDLQYTLSDYDKIKFKWPEGIPFEGELITRSSDVDSDTTFYGVMEVIKCMIVDPVTGDITTYLPNVDFTFDKATPTNAITWISANKPADGAVYSLKYSALVEWICFAPPQPRRERGTNLGQKVIMRKKHIVFSGV
jgi:hypothetical protein